MHEKAGTMNQPEGFTIAEVLMALSVASVIALAAGGVAAGLSYSFGHQDDYRQSVQDASGVIRELRTQVNKAQLITGVWGTALAVWTDANADLATSRGEMVLIRYDAPNKQLLETRLVFPSTWSAAQIASADAAISMTVATDQNSLLASLTGDSHGTTSVLAEDVQAFSVTGKAAGANNNVIQASVTVGTGAKRVTLRSEMTLRASLIGKV